MLDDKGKAEQFIVLIARVDRTQRKKFIKLTG